MRRSFRQLAPHDIVFLSSDTTSRLYKRCVVLSPNERDPLVSLAYESAVKQYPKLTIVMDTDTKLIYALNDKEVVNSVGTYYICDSRNSPKTTNELEAQLTTAKLVESIHSTWLQLRDDIFSKRPSRAVDEKLGSILNNMRKLLT